VKGGRDGGGIEASPPRFPFVTLVPSPKHAKTFVGGWRERYLTGDVGWSQLGMLVVRQVRCRWVAETGGRECIGSV
jgi:hypothetical protein